jgi:hypothetical protein
LTIFADIGKNDIILSKDVFFAKNDIKAPKLSNSTFILFKAFI